MNFSRSNFPFLLQAGTLNFLTSCSGFLNQMFLGSELYYNPEDLFVVGCSSEA